MAETLFNQFADEGALQAQRDFFLNEVLKPIKEGIKGLNVNIGTVDSSQSKKSVDELSRTVDALEKQLKSAQDEIAALNTQLKEYSVVSKTSAGDAQKLTATWQDFHKMMGKINMKEISADWAAWKQAIKENDQATIENLKNKYKLSEVVIDNAKATKAESQADKESATAKKLKAQSAKEIEKAQKAEQKAVEDAANDYLQLAKAYNEAALRAKNFVLRLGENHPVAVQAVKDANDLANILKKLDASVGQHQRNVGNYASAVTGLGFSFTQVARELPSLAVNFQQFALAISNNLPYVAEDLANTRKEIAALRAEGKQAPSMFQAIIKSLFTWQTILAAGIAIFTLYAKEIGNFFTKLFDTSTAASRAQEQLREAMAGVNAQAQAQSAELITLYKITQDTTQQLDDRVDATNRILEVNEEVNKATGESIKLLTDEKGVLKENADQWEKLIAVLIRVEKTKAVLSLIGDAFKKVVEEQTKSLDKQTTQAGNVIRGILHGPVQGGVKTIEVAIENKNTAIEDAKTYLALLEKTLQEGLKTGEFDLSGVFDGSGANKAIKAINKLFTAELEFQRDQLLKIADSEDKFIQDRINARIKASQIDQQLVKLRADFEISEARRNAEFQIKEQKGNAENIKIIQSNLAKEIAFIQKTSAVEIKRINAERDEDILGLQNEFYKKLIDTVAAGQKALEAARKMNFEDRTKEAKKDFDEETLLIHKFYEQQNAILQSNLKKGRISLDQYNIERKTNDKELKKALIDAEIQYVEKLIEIEKLKPDGGNKLELERKLYMLRKGLRDQDLQDYEDYRNKLAEINKKIAEDQKKALEKLADQVKETFFNVIAGTYDAQINKIRDQIDVVNELKAAEIDRINSSTATAEEKAARIKIVEARAQNDREALERRQRVIERNRAIVERAQSAFSMTIAGIRDVARIKSAAAVAYANTLATIPPPFNVPAAVAVKLNVLKEIPISIATTAAGLASILATPIPKFYTGTESSPEGPAEVAERGPELAVDKKGNVKLYEKHTLTYLTKGTKIYPADVTKAILNAAEQERKGLMKSFGANVNVSAPDHSEELKEQTKLLKDIKNKQTQFIIYNQPGIETSTWYHQHFKS